MKSVGIDIGTTHVRVVEITGINADSSAKVSKVAIEPVPAGALKDGRVRNPSQVAYSVRQAMRAAKVAPYGPVVGLCSSITSLARLSLPEQVKDKDRAGTIRLQDTPISPQINTRDAVLAVQQAGIVRDDGTVPLLVAAAPGDEIKVLMDTCRGAKITPRAIDLAVGATMRACMRMVPGANDVAAIVDVGAGKTAIAVRQGAHIRYLRVLPTGGDDITSAITGVTSIGYDEAEQLKKSTYIGRPPEESFFDDEDGLGGYGSINMASEFKLPTNGASLIETAVETRADTLIEEIARALDADSERNPDMPIQRISLTGGGAGLGGFREKLQERIGVQSSIADPWADLSKAKISAPENLDDAEIINSLATAIGLAMWEGGNKK